MLEIDTTNVIDVLFELGHLDSKAGATVEWLSWGVSNCVLRIDCGGDRALVVKQSRRQLRTEVAWFSQLERIWREVDVMRYLKDVLPDGAVPRVLFEERELYLFGMQAVDPSHTVWKSDLLAGQTDARVARLAGRYLGTIHRQSSGDPQLAERWADRRVFEELRIDPFYRYVAQRHAAFRDALSALIEATMSQRTCLVLADFSPKNILVTPAGISLVDFETAHYGDPAFDLGFFLSHLLLKTILHLDQRSSFQAMVSEFWSSYSQAMSSGTADGGHALECLQRRMLLHLAACLVARIDGTSPIDYLRQADQRDQARRLATRILADPIDQMAGVFALLDAG